MHASSHCVLVTTARTLTSRTQLTMNKKLFPLSCPYFGSDAMETGRYLGKAVRTPCYSVSRAGVVCAYSVVSSLVFIVDPVEGFHRAIQNAVLGNPFIGVTATLGEDS